MLNSIKPPELQPFTWCPQCESHYSSTFISCPLCADKAARKPSPTPHAAATFAKALRLIGGDRRADYGGYAAEAQHMAAMWNAILNSEVVQPRHVPLMMAALKLRREAVKHKADNLVDMCGYAGLLSELEGGK